MAGNARDVRVDIIGRDRTTDAARSAAGNFDRVRARNDALKDSFQKGAIAIAAVTGAFVGATKIMNEGLSAGLVKANAQVALGATGYQQLSAAAETSAHAVGLTTTEYLNSAGQAALLAKNMQFGQDTAIAFGKALPELANRLSVLSSGTRSASESSDMLRSAIAGEFDPLQAVGINISAVIVAQKALSIQQQSGSKLTTQQANALAVLSIVSEQTAQATDVLATAQGKAYQQAQANNAALRESWGQLEQTVTPIITTAIDGVNRWVESVKQLGETQNESNTGLAALKNWLNVLVPMTNVLDAIFEPMIDKQKDAAAASVDVAAGFTAAGDAASGSASEVYAFAKSIEYADDAAMKSANAQLTARDAARGFQAAVDAAKTALSEQGRTLDITTEKGRANQKALDDIADSANRQAQAILNAGGTQRDYERSLAGSRAQLEAMAVRFGMTKGAAAEYARTVLGIPSSVSTNVNVTTTVNGTRVSEGYFQRVLSAPRGRVGAFGGGTTFLPFAAGDLGGGRTQAPAPVQVDVASTVLLDGAPFAARIDTAVERSAWRARVGRR
jgi:hypothetical protein